jgi:hypothetical protein
VAALKATVVQFAAALTNPDAARLRAEYDLTLERYIPDLGYLERRPPETVDSLRDDFLVRACVPLDLDLKVAPSVSGEDPTPGSPVEFSATLFDDADPAAVEALLAATGASDVHIVDDRPIGGRANARFTLDELAPLSQIAELDDLVWIEPVAAIVSHNADAAETIQSGTVAKSPIWDQGLHGEGQVIGVIDEGNLAIDHCFFADAAPNKPGPDHRKVLALFNESGSTVAKHSIQVSGIAAGDELGNSGAHKHRGGAWNAKLVYSNEKDLLRPASRSLLYLLNRAKDAGAVIHTMSWGNDKKSLYDNRARDVDAFSWANEDHLVVAAGANTGGVNSPPGTAKNVLCVAAAKAFPNEMSRGSGVDGPTADRRRKPEIVAIGGQLELATSGTTCGTGLVGGFHTSFATPHVAAAAALVRQYFMEGFYPKGKRGPPSAFRPTGALLKAVLLNSTVNMTGEPGYPSNAEGWGLIRLNRALYFHGGPRRLAVKDVRRADGLDVGTDLSSTDYRRRYSLFVNESTEQLKITLVWTDPPPSEMDYPNPPRNAIKLTAAPEEGLGEEYLGNDIDVQSGLSRPEGDGATDQFNNVQMIIVNNPTIGRWTVTVSTKSIWVDTKPYRPGVRPRCIRRSGPVGVLVIASDKD